MVSSTCVSMLPCGAEDVHALLAQYSAFPRCSVWYAGPCEFLNMRGFGYTMVVEAKQSIRAEWEANICQTAAQPYTMAGYNFEEGVQSGVQKARHANADLNAS